MKKLNDCRNEIDEINKEMLKLFEKRMALSKEVVLYKTKNNLEIFQPEREQEIISEVEKDIENKELAVYAANFMQDLMNVSKSYQATFMDNKNTYQTSKHKTKDIKVGYQGVQGSFSYQALKNYFGEVETKNYSLFEDVFKALANSEIDYGVLPLENSSTGAINDNYDLVRDYDLHIVGEYSLEVNQHLLGVKGSKLEDLKEVYSHIQGINQCHGFFSKHRSITPKEFSNTAASAKYISEQNDKSKGAIASKEAAKIYNLDVLEESINDSKTNHTRFIIVGRNLEDDKDCNCCSIVFTLKHQPGTLAQILTAIKDHNINLSRIESRPIEDKNWEYYFYIDFEGSIHDTNVITALSQIKTNCLTLKILGNYKQASITK